MSNAALAYTPYRYDTVELSPAARRILRRSTPRDCPSGKKGYRTARKARIALATLQRDEQRRQTALGQQAKVERHFYPCEHCEDYHLTSRA